MILLASVLSGVRLNRTVTDLPPRPLVSSRILMGPSSFWLVAFFEVVAVGFFFLSVEYANFANVSDPYFGFDMNL